MLDKLLKDESEPAHLRERKRPIAEHLDEFMVHVRSARAGKRGRSARASRLAIVRAYLRRAVAATGAGRPPDLIGPKVEQYLCDLLEGGITPEVPPGGPFTLPEVAKILGRAESTIHKKVRRHDLPVVGRHPRRRFPRETVVALAGLGKASRGLSGGTVAQHAEVLRRFGKWLAKKCQFPENPLGDLATGGAGGEARRARRALSTDEMTRLLDATLASRESFCGLTSRDRHVLCSVALGTGFRRSELASLTVGAFRIDDATPHVFLHGDIDKRGIAVEQP